MIGAMADLIDDMGNAVHRMTEVPTARSPLVATETSAAEDKKFKEAVGDARANIMKFLAHNDPRGDNYGDS